LVECIVGGRFGDLPCPASSTSPSLGNGPPVSGRPSSMPSPSLRPFSPAAALWRHGAVGKHGCNRIVERFTGTMKAEGLRRPPRSLLSRVPHLDLAVYIDWYNRHRPHSGLEGRTPHEVYEGLPPPTAPPDMSLALVILVRVPARPRKRESKAVARPHSHLMYPMALNLSNVSLSKDVFELS
jgi:hypothetical protein